MWHEQVQRLASEQPARPALIEAGRALTRGELATAASALAQLLAGHGVGSGRTVAAKLPNSLESAVAVLAVARLGATLLVLDPALKPGEVQE